MRELTGAGLGEVYAVLRTQPADLAFEIGTLVHKASGFIAAARAISTDAAVHPERRSPTT